MLNLCPNATLTSALQPITHKPVLLLGIIPSRVQDFTLIFLKPHTVLGGQVSKPSKVSLCNASSFQYIYLSSQFGIICKFGGLHSILLSISLTKTRNSVRSSVSPRGTPLMISYQSDFEALPPFGLTPSASLLSFQR